LKPKKYVWRIRTDGIPANPRFRVYKRRTHGVIGTKEDVEVYAEELRKYQGLKILWIKNMGEYNE